MKNTIKVVCVIIGTIIGAGFASGKEIYMFFNVYGIYGFLGIMLSSILTGIVIYSVLKQARKLKGYSYNEYLKEIKLNEKTKNIMNIIVNVFLLIMFYIMIAGFCAYFTQEFHIKSIFISIIVCGMCYITFMNNIEGVTKINMILIPFLIIMIILMAIKTNTFSAILELDKSIYTNVANKGKWLISSLEYASYNSILLIPMLISLKDYTYKKEKNIAIIVSIVFFILAALLNIVLLKGEENIKSIDLPLIYIANQFGNIYKYVYGIAIIAAIYTSAISAGYEFIENCSKNKEQYKKICIFIYISAIFISKIGFSKLVNLLYPVFGLIGLAQIIYIICKKILLNYRTKIEILEKNDKN